jgi:hypothetical protein
MKPNSSESLNVFDMIWQEIIHASCSPLKGCLHAPDIMKMIEVVTQFRYEKGTRHLSYTPFWIDPNNPAVWMKKAPASSREQTQLVPPILLLVMALPLHVVVVEVMVAAWEPGWLMGLHPFSLCAGTFLLTFMSWTGSIGKRVAISVVSLSLWEFLLLPTRRRASPCTPLEINEWHQQAYGVPFMSTDDEDVEEEEFFDDRDQFVPPPHQGDPGPSSSYPPPGSFRKHSSPC